MKPDGKIAIVFALGLTVILFTACGDNNKNWTQYLPDGEYNNVYSVQPNQKIQSEIYQTIHYSLEPESEEEEFINFLRAYGRDKNSLTRYGSATKADGTTFVYCNGSPDKARILSLLNGSSSNYMPGYNQLEKILVEGFECWTEKGEEWSDGIQFVKDGVLATNSEGIKLLAEKHRKKRGSLNSNPLFQKAINMLEDNPDQVYYTVGVFAEGLQTDGLDYPYSPLATIMAADWRDRIYLKIKVSFYYESEANQFVNYQQANESAFKEKLSRILSSFGSMDLKLLNVEINLSGKTAIVTAHSQNRAEYKESVLEKLRNHRLDENWNAAATEAIKHISISEKFKEYEDSKISCELLVMSQCDLWQFEEAESAINRITLNEEKKEDKDYKERISALIENEKIAGSVNGSTISKISIMDEMSLLPLIKTSSRYMEEEEKRQTIFTYLALEKIIKSLCKEKLVAIDNTEIESEIDTYFQKMETYNYRRYSSNLEDRIWSLYRDEQITRKRLLDYVILQRMIAALYEKDSGEESLEGFLAKIFNDATLTNKLRGDQVSIKQIINYRETSYLGKSEPVRSRYYN